MLSLNLNKYSVLLEPTFCMILSMPLSGQHRTVSGCCNECYCLVLFNISHTFVTLTNWSHIERLLLSVLILISISSPLFQLHISSSLLKLPEFVSFVESFSAYRQKDSCSVLEIEIQPELGVRCSDNLYQREDSYFGRVIFMCTCLGSPASNRCPF